MKSFIKNHIDMPDRLIDLLIRFLNQENGILSKRARPKEFNSLTEEEVKTLGLHLGNSLIPKQLLIMVKKRGSSVVPLLYDTSLLIYQEKKTFPNKLEKISKINVMALALALCGTN